MLPIFTTEQVKDGTAGGYIIDLSEYIKKKDAATKEDISELTDVIANKLDAEPQHKHEIGDIKQLENTLSGKYDTSEKYSYSVILSDSEKIPYLESPKIKLLSIGDADMENPYQFYIDESNGDLMIVCNEMLVATYSKSSHNWIMAGVNIGELNTAISSAGDYDSRITENTTKIAECVENLSTTTSSITAHDSRITENTTKIAENTTKIAECTDAILMMGGTYETLNQRVMSMHSAFGDYITNTDKILKNHYDALLMLCQEHGMIDSNTSDGNKITPQ